MENLSSIPQANTPLAPHVRPKIGRNAIGFYSVIIGSILLVLVAFLFLFTKFGLVRPPLLSRFYHGPQVTRQVDAPMQDLSAFTQLLGKRFIEQELRGGGQGETVTLRVTESELSSVLPKALEENIQDKDMHLVHSQVVLLPQEVELLAQFERHGIYLDMLVRFIPRMQQGRVHFEPTFFQLGDIPLPVPVATQLMALLFGRDLGEWDVRSAELAPQDIRLSDGAMEIVLKRLAR